MSRSSRKGGGCKKGNHTPVEFNIIRTNKKTGVKLQTIGIRCKFCKKAQSKHRTRVVEN